MKKYRVICESEEQLNTLKGIKGYKITDYRNSNQPTYYTTFSDTRGSLERWYNYTKHNSLTVSPELDPISFEEWEKEFNEEIKPEFILVNKRWKKND